MDVAGFYGTSVYIYKLTRRHKTVILIFTFVMTRSLTCESRFCRTEIVWRLSESCM